MTVLTHRVLDAQGRPVAGLVATVAVYAGRAGNPGTYHRDRATSAVSDDDGLLTWTLPSWPGRGTPTYVVSGIEPRQVLVSVPPTVSTATVTETRTGTLPLPPGQEPGRDLVTQAELAQRLAGLTAGTGPGGSGATADTPEAHGAAGNGSTDDTAAVQALMQALSNAGGGTGYLTPGRTYRCDGQLIKPPGYIRLTSAAGPRYDFNDLENHAAPAGGGILDLRYAGADAAFLSLSRGVLELDHLTVANNGASTTPLILSTYPQVRIHDAYFTGNPARLGPTCDQDAIILGGTSSAVTVPDVAGSSFGGYGGFVKDCTFTRIRRIVTLQTFVNGIVVRGNAADPTCGSNRAVDAPIVLDSGGTEADLTHHVQGNVIADNTLEVLKGYAHGVILRNNARQNVVRDNGFWDPIGPGEGGRYVSDVLIDEATNCIDNTIRFSGYSNPGNIPFTGLTNGRNDIAGHGARRTSGLPAAATYRNAGNVAVNSTNWTIIPFVDDPLIVRAAAGDLIEVGLSAFVGGQSYWLYLDATTNVFGAPVNYLSRQQPGPSNFSSGVAAWICPPNGQWAPVTGTVQYKVVPDDLQSGSVRIRLVGRLQDPGSRDFYGTTDICPQLWVKNLGPAE